MTRRKQVATLSREKVGLDAERSEPSERRCDWLPHDAALEGLFVFTPRDGSSLHARSSSAGTSEVEKLQYGFLWDSRVEVLGVRLLRGEKRNLILTTEVGVCSYANALITRVNTVHAYTLALTKASKSPC